MADHERFFKNSKTGFGKLFNRFRWLFISTIVGILAGAASALFLWLLDFATKWRELNIWIVALLPICGFSIAFVYQKWGKEISRGHQLILDEIHDPTSTIPLRMAPLVLFGTLATHLFGGSAGREGTSVQMGASFADQLTKVFPIHPKDRRTLLMAGMSAGFASVFGTPMAGAVFGLEVLGSGRFKYDALFYCLVSAWVGHETSLFLGIHHTIYKVSEFPIVTFLGLFQSVMAGAVFGITGAIFARSTHKISKIFESHISYAPFRPFLGGVVIVILSLVLGTRYLGLGIPVIEASFLGPISSGDFALKILFTVITLGSGFKGGEVTPLFFIGATLGNALSPFFSLPLSLLVAMGFVAVFAGAAKTPLACTLMAVEIFGSQIGLFAALACGASFLFSGRLGIYHFESKVVTYSHFLQFEVMNAWKFIQNKFKKH